MTNIIENERSWGIQLISKINHFLTTRWYIIKKASGESGLKCNWKTLFPDVYLFWWTEINNILQWWELKLPDTKIDNIEFINNAEIKAESLWLNSFLLWNFSEAVLYVKEWNHFHIKKHWNNLSTIKTRLNALEVISSTPEVWEVMMIEIIEDLNNYFQDWILIWKSLVDTINLTTIIDSISNFSLGFKDFLKEKSIEDIRLSFEIDLWWLENKSSYQEKDDLKKWEILTKIIINNWINKIIYAHILKKHYNEARIIERLSNVNNVNEAVEIFDEISVSCDFWNIFKNYSIKTDNINADLFIPDEILNAFKEFNSFLNAFNIEELSPELIEKILVNTIFQNKRKLAGQFSTPDELARILVRSTIENKRSIVYDWCCWTWTIIKEVYNYKRSDLSDSDTLDSIFFSDKFSFPVQISNLSLSKPDNKWRLLQLFKEDIFKVKEWLEFKLYNANNWEEIIKKFPKIDCILSNLPFIQQEDFEKFNPWTKTNINLGIKNDLWIWNKLNWKSDLYAYIIIHLYSLLKDTWKLWIIISNSWLSTNWGNEFKKVLLNYFYIDKVITSWKWKWFDNAKVVTNILILKKRNNIWDIWDDESIYFITLLKKIEEISEEEISRISSHILLNRELDDYVKINKIWLNEINVYEKLSLWWNAFFANISWINNIVDKLVDLNSCFLVNRGERTWCDSLFYPKDLRLIDEWFITKTLKTTKWHNHYDIIPDANTFVCSLWIDELLTRWFNKTISWINRYENRKNSITTKNWKEWYNLPCNIKVDFVINVNLYKNITFYKINESSFIWQRGIGLKSKWLYEKDILHSLLNSILIVFFVEAVWFWRWLGALDLNGDKIKSMKFLNPNILTIEQKTEINRKFDIIKLREIKNIDIEFNLEDRIEFDKYILECYWISEIYEDLKKALISLYKIRSSVR